MADSDSEWTRKGGTLSDKTACREFGLSYDEIVQAIRENRLQYRRQAVFGNPFLRLLRSEVEALVGAKKGDDFLKKRKAKKELAEINRELKVLQGQIALLEQRKWVLTDELKR